MKIIIKMLNNQVSLGEPKIIYYNNLAKEELGLRYQPINVL